jgi:hypothetical protein
VHEASKVSDLNNGWAVARCGGEGEGEGEGESSCSLIANEALGSLGRTRSAYRQRRINRRSRGSGVGSGSLVPATPASDPLSPSRPLKGRGRRSGLGGEIDRANSRQRID